jgi:hypothetical protein
LGGTRWHPTSKSGTRSLQPLRSDAEGTTDPVAIRDDEMKIMWRALRQGLRSHERVLSARAPRIVGQSRTAKQGVRDPQRADPTRYIQIEDRIY